MKNLLKVPFFFQSNKIQLASANLPKSMQGKVATQNNDSQPKGEVEIIYSEVDDYSEDVKKLNPKVETKDYLNDTSEGIVYTSEIKQINNLNQPVTNNFPSTGLQNNLPAKNIPNASTTYKNSEVPASLNNKPNASNIEVQNLSLSPTPTNEIQNQPEFISKEELEKKNGKSEVLEEKIIDNEKKPELNQNLSEVPQPKEPEENITTKENTPTKQLEETSAEVSDATPSGINQTMKEFLRKAYEENPDINAARSLLKQADEALPQAYSGFLPSLEINTSNTRENSGFQNSSTKRTFYTNSKSLDARQELFGGGETYYAIKSALKRIDAAEQQLASTEQKFFLDALSGYVNVIFTSKIYNLSKNNEEIIGKQLESTRQRFVIGDATKTDVAQSESRYASAKSSAITNYNEYIVAKSNFKRIFLRDAPENLEMPSELPKIPDSIDKAIQIAFAKNPDLKRTEAEKDQRKHEVEATKSQLMPQVDLVGSVSDRESVTGTNLFATESERVAVNVRMPLYDSGVTYSKVRESKDRSSQANFSYENQKNVVRDNLTRAWQQVQFNTENIEFTKASLVAAQFAVEGVKEEQKEGARLIQDILDAERERFAAEINYARSIRDSVLSIYNLKTILGELTAEELSLGISNYNKREHFDNTKFKLFGF